MVVTLEGSLSVCCVAKQIHFAHARDFCIKVKNSRGNHHGFTSEYVCQPLQHASVQSLHFSVVESDSHQGISNDLPKGFNLEMVGILICDDVMNNT